MKLTNGYYLDEHQGEDADARAFGYIGRSVKGMDYKGFFFTYPSNEPAIWTVHEREQVMDSLEYAEFDEGEKISWHTARALLNRYLRQTYDLRRTRASVKRSQFAY